MMKSLPFLGGFFIEDRERKKAPGIRFKGQERFKTQGTRKKI
jgi:hypothetical protein